MIDAGLRLKVKRLDRDLPMPEYKTAHAAGMDLYASFPAQDIHFAPLERRMFGLGIAVEIPHGYFGVVALRSSLGRRGFYIPNSIGVIDSDYRGELMMVLVNGDTHAHQEIRRGDRVAQLILYPSLQMPTIEVMELTDTVRGAGGFGSTGR